MTEVPFIIMPVWILELDTITAHAKMVLAGLYSFADQEGVCWPSYAALAGRTGISERTVRRALDDLVDAGLVRRESRRRADGGQSSNVYTLLWIEDSYKPLGHSDREGDGQNGHGPVAAEDTHELDTFELEPPLDSPHEERVSDQVRQVFDAWAEATGRDGNIKLDSRRRTRILWALKTYGLEDTLRAVRNVVLSDWHMGRDPGTAGRRYDDIALVLKDAEHVERFVALDPSPQEDRGRQVRIDRAAQALAAGEDMGTAKAFTASEEELAEAVERSMDMMLMAEG